MTPERKDSLIATYRDGLLLDTLPFWIRHAVDREHGGFLTSLDRDGTVVDSDKAIWPQGRFSWLLATLYNTVEPRDEWIALAKNGIEFLEKHAFDEDGQMFFLVTREGRPLRKRRYVYSVAFTCMAFAAYAKAAQSAAHEERARSLFEQFVKYSFTPGLIPDKVDSRTRPMKSLGPLMITINLAQVLRESIGFAGASEWIDRCIAEIRGGFVKRDHEVVMENIGPNGEILDHFDGRLLNPGHAIEAAWFVLHEARIRNCQPDLIELGTRMLDWMWVRGWDEEHGGLFYYRDLHEKPVQEYWHDMKFWWPHNEAIIATLLAHQLTGHDRYEDWHRRVHEWSYAHFPDPKHGEWFGYLHRDGRVSVPLKGNHWKGPFHLPRMQLYCWKLLETGLVREPGV